MKLETFKRVYRQLNAQAFSNLLEEPIIEFTRARNVSALYFCDGWFTRIQINPRNFPRNLSVETMFHEMIHQYIDEILKAEDTNDHGEIFKQWYTRLIPDYINPDMEHYIP